jgi:hypothetical protein
LSERWIKFVEECGEDTENEIRLKPFVNVVGDQVHFGVTDKGKHDMVFAVLDASGLYRLFFPEWVGLPLDNIGQANDVVLGLVKLAE